MSEEGRHPSPRDGEEGALVVVVDDDEGGRYTKVRALQKAGFRVAEASNGREALDLVGRLTPSVVCLDVQLPDVDGFEVCRLIKTDPRTRDTLILQTSATFLRGEDRVRGLEGGADAYLTEPFETDVLIATMRALVRTHRAEEGLRTSAQQWRATFDAIADGIALVDVQGCVLRCNRAFRDLLGDDFTSIIGERLGVLAPPVGGPEAQAFERVLASGRREEAWQRLGERHFHTTADPITGDGGEVRGVVYIVADVSLQQRARQQLEEVIRELQASRAELCEKLAELEDFQDVVVGRELKMMELEKELAGMRQELARLQRHECDEVEEG